MIHAPLPDIVDLIAADPVKGAFMAPKGLRADGTPLFRMLLWRIWEQTLPMLAVVMLNPSTADARQDDMTITRLIGFAKDHGYGGVLVVNRYALRATDPSELLKYGTINAIGPSNKEWISAAITGRDVLVAWGSNWVAEDWLHEVESMLFKHGIDEKVYCLGYTADGYPRHPSRLAGDTKFEPWDVNRRKRRPAL